ncbi:interleukin-6 receptor subunit alpha isoform X2 [Opisthocomus hoazin]|uniref:interleukin-6 receptor subunit alpha isoform X2 n=1 Tax=Opisthocomus hoazin TaxID=30419 RepID=UPI003F537A77
MAAPLPPPILLLLLLLLLLFLAAAGRPCGPAGVSRDTLLRRPGTNVTLTCRDEGPTDVPVSWEVEERGAAGGRGRRLAAEGNALLLRRLRYEDSGRYRCVAGGRPLRSLRLLVEEPPETPRVSCYRRSHEKDVLCEWPLRAKPSPGTRATLWVKQRFAAENATEQRCRYFAKAQKFLCRVKVPPGTEDTKPLVVSTCVSNAAGGSAGEDRIITLSSVPVKPDPPINVTVEALEKATRRLRVSWSYPSSWDPRFYWLRFQVRYRPEPARTFTEVDQVTTTWLEIRDAWPGTRHVAQVRAQEEFGHGAWSEWSREAVGTPWIDPRDLMSDVGPLSSQFPTDDGTYGVTLPPELFGDDANGAGGAVVDASARSGASPYASLVAGGSLVLGIALFAAVVVRYRQLWRTDGRRGAKPEGEGQHVLVPLAPPSPPLSETPLLPPASPPAPGALHVTNLDYFFSGQ